MDGHLINGIGITSYLCGKNEILIFHIIQNKLKGLNEKKKLWRIILKCVYSAVWTGNHLIHRERNLGCG